MGLSAFAGRNGSHLLSRLVSDDLADGRSYCGWHWSIAIAHKAHGVRVLVSSGPARKFGLSFAPPLLVGGVLTAALIQTNAEALLPGVWLYSVRRGDHRRRSFLPFPWCL